MERIITLLDEVEQLIEPAITETKSKVNECYEAFTKAHREYISSAQEGESCYERHRENMKVRLSDIIAQKANIKEQISVAARATDTATLSALETQLIDLNSQESALKQIYEAVPTAVKGSDVLYADLVSKYNELVDTARAMREKRFDLMRHVDNAIKVLSRVMQPVNVELERLPDIPDSLTMRQMSELKEKHTGSD